MTFSSTHSLARSRDPKIICSLAWRPSFLAFGTYCAIGGPACRRFEGIAQHYAAMAADVILKWALHDCLWYFLGLSAVLIEKDYLTLAYIQVRNDHETPDFTKSRNALT